MLRHRLRHVFRASICLVVLWVVGQVFRDVCWPTSLCFYFPSPLLVGVLLVAATISWRVTGRLRQSSVLLLLALLPLAMTIFVENRWARPAAARSSADGLRLVHWNVYRGQKGWNRVQRQLLALDADVVALSELPHELDFPATMRQFGADYNGLRFGEMAVIARGRVAALSEYKNGDARAHLVEFEVDGRRHTLIIADLPSSILVARDPLLKWLCNLVARHQPDLVVGDLNAPRRSLELSHLPDGYAHAYDLAGSGWSYTWPMPVPMWAIDQCIVGQRIQVLRYQLQSPPGSDHRLQWLDFR